MSSLVLVLYCAASFATGGVVKGTFGIGLPLVAMPLLTMVLHLPTAASLVVVPMMATNLAQSFMGGRAAIVARLRRFAPMLATLVVCILFATKGLALIPERLLYALIGLLVIGSSVLGRLKPRLRISESQERWLGPIAGAVAGALGGMTTFYGPVLLAYLVGLRLPKDEFVAAISLIYFIGAVALGVGVVGNGLTDPLMLGLSALTLIPSFLGIRLGQMVRMRLDERRFATWLFVLYLVIGASFFVKTIPGLGTLP